MADNPYEIGIHPCDEGVQVRFDGLGTVLPSNVLHLYKDILGATLPKHDGYRIRVEDNTVVVSPEGDVITNPQKFATVQMQVADHAERVADVFADAMRLGDIFKAQSVAE